MDVVCSVPDTPERDETATTGDDIPSTSMATLPLIASIGTALVLVSPFFFWGTSMVAMKVSLSLIVNT